jgi:DNA processing protein
MTHEQLPLGGAPAGAPGPVDDQERVARAALGRLVEPGRPSLHAAVARYGAVALWAALRGTGRVPGLGPEGAAGARHRARGWAPERDLERLHRLGGRLLCPGDDEWPQERLSWPPRTLENAPPLALHVLGPRRLAEAVDRSVSVVGARACTRYGEQVAADLALGLADRRCTVVSGAAYGIDAAAHRGALLSEVAPTVAVLACGLDTAYPRGHEQLLARIAGSGLVVSELPVASAPTRARFLVRNRLIAALSAGTVAVEAARRSGSLATVERARALGREIMAVPGNVTSALSGGTNALLRDGATCVTDAADVLDLVGELGVDAEPDRPREQRVRDELSATVRQVLDAVPVRRSAGPASIARVAGVSPLVVQQVLPPLVLNGLVEQTPDGFRLTALGAGRPAHRTGGHRDGGAP